MNYVHRSGRNLVMTTSGKTGYNGRNNVTGFFSEEGARGKKRRTLPCTICLHISSVGKTGKELRAVEEIDRKSGITRKWFVRSSPATVDRK